MYIVNICILIGLLSLLFGIILIFAPGILKTLNEFFEKVIKRIDILAFSYRLGLKVSFVLVFAFLFFTAYYFSRKY